MKKIIFTLLVCSFSLGLFSQSDVWTKADRTNLYDDCMSYITKYKNTTNDQRESISLCYIGEVTKKYTKVDFNAMIDIEIKRIKEAVINQCAKNLGIDLNTEVKKEEPVVVEKKEVEVPKTVPKNVLSRESLIGQWKTDINSIIEFKSDGTYSHKYLYNYFDGQQNHVKDNLFTGDWFLDDKGFLTLTVNWTSEIPDRKKKHIDHTEKYTDPAGKKYKFITFSEGYFKYEQTTPGSTAIQANRVE